MQQSQNKKHPVLDSSLPFPEWIKKHPVIQKSKCNNKVFGRLGIPNFADEVEIANTEEAKGHATALLQVILPELNRQVPLLLGRMETLGASITDADEKAKKLSALSGLISAVHYLAYQLTTYQPDFIVITDKRVELKLRSDLYGFHISEPSATDIPPDDKTKTVKRVKSAPLFKKGQSLIGTFVKMKELAAELGAPPFNNHEQWQQFKDFSRTNVGVNKCKVVFSHTGEEALWDIATISMRGGGWSSCQSWHVANAIGLIGSIASRFCGTMYLASDRDVPGFGKVMLNRTMVRLVISAKTGAPAIIIDRMYPSENKETVKQFKRALAKRTSLDVVYVGDGTSVATDYYIPNETNIDQPARPYTDTKFQFKDRAKILKAKQATPASDITILVSRTEAFKQKSLQDIKAFVKQKRDAYSTEYEEFEKLRNEYSLAKMKWEEEDRSRSSEKFGLKAPKMKAELLSFFKGGVEHLFKYLEKNNHAAASDVFGNIVLSAVNMPDMSSVQTKEAYHRRFLIAFIKDSSNVKARAWKKCQEGAWMKSFPRSSERLFEFVFAQLKSACLSSIKELIRLDT